MQNRPPPFLVLPAEIRAKIFDFVFTDLVISIQTNFVRLPRTSNAAQIFRTCHLFNQEARPIFFGKIVFEVSFIADLKTHLGSSAASLIRKVVWKISPGQIKYLHDEVRQRWERAGLSNVQYLQIRVSDRQFRMFEPGGFLDVEKIATARRTMCGIVNEILAHSEKLLRATEKDPSVNLYWFEYTLDDGSRNLEPYVRGLMVCLHVAQGN